MLVFLPVIPMLIFFPALMVAVLVWLIHCNIKWEKETKAKLDGLEKIVKRIEEKMICKEVWDHTPED